MPMADPPLHIISLVLLFFATNLLQNSHTTKTHNGLSLQMIHRYSPKLPIYRVNLTRKEKIMESIQISNARVKSLGRLYGTRTNSSSSSSRHANADWIKRPPLGYFAENYYVEVGIGIFDQQTPMYNTYYLGFDTGSDLTWTQCEGCKECFHQVNPYFPANRSKTYRPTPCDDQCSECESGVCMLQVEYGDGSTVNAIAARETFTLHSVGNIFVYLFNIFFGCGIDMQNFGEGDEPDNMVSGILGMSKGENSFWNQLGDTEGRFSYCLQTAINAEGKPMYLRFGTDVIEETGMHSTPFVQDLEDYYLTLEGISVNNIRLAVDATVFQRRADGSGGCIIDSGTTLSYIPSEAYSLFITAVSNFFVSENPNWRVIPDPSQEDRLCYEQFKKPVSVDEPTIIFHFANNADFVMHLDVVFESSENNGNDLLCLMILESPQSAEDMTVLGAYQQTDQRIIYDNANGLLLFKEADCTNNN